MERGYIGGVLCPLLCQFDKTSERGNHGDIKGAVTALQAEQTLRVRKDSSVVDQWREKSDVANRAATMTWQEVAFNLNLLDSTEECVPDGQFKLDFTPAESAGLEGPMKMYPIEQVLGNLNDQTACGISGFDNFLYKKLRVSDVKPFVEYFAGNNRGRLYSCFQ